MGSKRKPREVASHKPERYLVLAQRIADVLAGEYQDEALDALGAVFVQICVELGMTRRDFIKGCEHVWKSSSKVKADLRMRRMLDDVDAQALKENMLTKAKRDIDPLKKGK